MKLGICAVYLVSKENEKLLDLHLHQIEKHTQVPYKIYASANRLLPKFRQRLERHPQVQVCELPTVDMRGPEEHSFYLEHLVKIAIEDNCTHVVTLHVDSFPIRSGWAKELAGKLSDSCVLVAIMKEEVLDRTPDSACLLLHRDFYLKYHPTFLLSRVELSSPKYKQYRREVRHIVETGVGYGFKLYSERLTWYLLLKSKKREKHYPLSNIYGDLIFHLGAASYRDMWRINGSKTKIPLGILTFGSTLLPQRVKDIGYAVFPKRFLHFWHTGVIQDIYERARKQLLENPDSYLNYLRTGSRFKK